MTKESRDMATGPGRRPIAEILRACERARGSSSSGGPGWSVAFKDGAGHSIALFTLGSCGQVDHLAREVAGLGYFLTVLDDKVQEADFVFREMPVNDAPLLEPPVPPAPPPRLAIAQGDLVMEEYGGPVMLVRSTSRDLAYCVWFSEGAHMASGTFTVSRLVNVSSARRHVHAPAAVRRLADTA